MPARPHSKAQEHDVPNEKDIIRNCYTALATAQPDTVATILARHTRPDWHWRGMHPWHELNGPQAVAEAFWHPLLSSMSRVQQREDLFFAGRNRIDGFRSVWIVSMGRPLGLFDAPFPGICHTRRIAMQSFNGSRTG